MNPRVETTVEAGDWSCIADPDALARRAIAAAAEETAIGFAPEAEVSVLFTDDARVRALNAAWRRIDKATNVLSFPSGEPIGETPLLGDIVLACETLQAEALAEEKPLAHHLTHLIVHGFLHLVGFDHDAEAEAEAMEALERAILARLGIEDPYRDRMCHHLE